MIFFLCRSVSFGIGFESGQSMLQVKRKTTCKRTVKNTQFIVLRDNTKLMGGTVEHTNTQYDAVLHSCTHKYLLLFCSLASMVSEFDPTRESQRRKIRKCKSVHGGCCEWIYGRGVDFLFLTTIKTLKCTSRNAFWWFESNVTKKRNIRV